MPIELDPTQPEGVAQAIERLLGYRRPGVDPWWAAGLEQALGGGDRSAAQEARSGAGVVEP